MAFPVSPSDGDTHNEGGTLYEYHSSGNYWEKKGCIGFPPNPPSSPIIGYEITTDTQCLRDIVIVNGKPTAEYYITLLLKAKIHIDYTYLQGCENVIINGHSYSPDTYIYVTLKSVNGDSSYLCPNTYTYSSLQDETYTFDIVFEKGNWQFTEKNYSVVIPAGHYTDTCECDDYNNP